LAPLCRAIEEYNRQGPNDEIDHIIVNTGQHYDHDVAGVFFDEMNIPAPKYNLGVGSGSHGTQLARMLARMEPILYSLAPDWIIVYGDTNSTLAGALLAARLGIPLAHVEAGCRSAQIGQPEEQNRIVADHLSKLLLVVSHKDQANLEREGIGTPDDPLHRRTMLVGDIQLDALLQHAESARENAATQLQQFGIDSGGYYLLTIHRAENTDTPGRLRGILDAATALDLPVLFPVHPRTKAIMERERIHLNGNMVTAPPQGYLEMLALESHARKILTDSGGVQKEAFYLGVPCITLRDQTEWVETVEMGANRLAGAETASILAAVREEVRNDWKQLKPYGDGSAALKIVAGLTALPLA
jgi:UDP-N-acetylglucosamine 2-epimerase